MSNGYRAEASKKEEATWKMGNAKKKLLLGR